jgi:hypothetical protein
MTQLPDFFAWIKVINPVTGKVVPYNGSVDVPATLIVRYCIANDSHKPMGGFIEGRLNREGQPVQPNGQSVVPSNWLDLNAGKVWTTEYAVKETVPALFHASLYAEVSHAVDEESETNNMVGFYFSFDAPPPG